MIVTLYIYYIRFIFFRSEGTFDANLHHSLTGTLTIVRFLFTKCLNTEQCDPINSHLLFSVHYTDFVSKLQSFSFEF